MLFVTVRRCFVANGVHLVCADESVPAVKIVVLTNKSSVFNTVQLPVNMLSYFTQLCLALYFAHGLQRENDLIWYFSSFGSVL